MHNPTLRICIAVFLTAVLLYPSFGMMNTSTHIIGTARADYVDASNNTSCIEEDPLVPGWSKDVRLTNDSGDTSWRPDVATDLKNNIHIVWEDSKGEGYGIYYRKSENAGSSWSNETRVCEGQSPSITVDNDNILHLVYYRYLAPGEYDIYYCKSMDEGATWASSKRLTETPGASTCPEITLHNDTIYIAWIDKRDGGEFEIYYKKSIDKGETWCEDKRITNTPNESSMTSIAVDSNNNIYIVWFEAEENGSALCFTKSTNGGDTWLLSQTITHTNYGTLHGGPVIQTDLQNNIHIAWVDNRAREKGDTDIRYIKSIDGGNTWEGGVDISGHTELNTTIPNAWSGMPDMAIDKYNGVHIVWKCSNFSYIEEEGGWKRTSNDIYYRKSMDGGNTWSSIIRITYAASGGRMNKKADIDNNNILHMVWGDNRGIHSDNMEIYYKRCLYPVSEKPIIVTQLLNQTDCKPGNSITVSGNAVYNDFVVPNANVSIKIVETGEEWNTTTDSNGDYSKTIIAPSTSGNYTVRVTVTSGNHTGWKIMRLVVEQESTNGGTTNGDSTNGEQQNGEENKYWVNLNYVLGVAAVIAGCVIISVVLVKRRGKQPAKLKEEKKPTQMLRCPKCRKTFRVEVKQKPLNVKCPYCGKEGVIK